MQVRRRHGEVEITPTKTSPQNSQVDQTSGVEGGLLNPDSAFPAQQEASEGLSLRASAS